MKVCSVDGCERETVARSLCSMHWQRLRRTGSTGPAQPLSRSGAGNPNWKGGRVRGGDRNRYWKRYEPSHPAADPCGYVLEHRLVMEAHLGRFLQAGEIVHHLNEDPTDNRIENLSVMTQGEHLRLHIHGRAS